MVGGAPRAGRARALHAREHGLLGASRRAQLQGRRQRTRHGYEARRRPLCIRRDRDGARSRHRSRTRACCPPRARREGRARVLRLELPDSEAAASLDRQRPGGLVSTTALDITSVRARFSALDRRLAFFDGPGGTQCPDEVIDAISRYLREDNANIGAPYERSIRTDELVDRARERAGSFLGCAPEEVAFGQTMTAMNFLLTRALGRELEAGDEVLVTRLDHDANVAPWLALQQDIGVVVTF